MNKTGKVFVEIDDSLEFKKNSGHFRPGDKSGITQKITRKTNAR